MSVNTQTDSTPEIPKRRADVLPYNKQEMRNVLGADGNLLLQGTWELPESTLYIVEDDFLGRHVSDGKRRRSFAGIRKKIFEKTENFANGVNEIELLQSMPGVELPADLRVDGAEVYTYFDYEGKKVNSTTLQVKDGEAIRVLDTDSKVASKAPMFNYPDGHVFVRTSQPSPEAATKKADTIKQDTNDLMDVCRIAALEQRSAEQRKSSTEQKLGKSGLRRALGSLLRTKR